MQRRLTALATATALAAISLVTWGAAPGSAAAPLLVISAPAEGSASTVTQQVVSGTSDCLTGSCSGITVAIYAGPGATGTPVQTLTAPRGAGWSVTTDPLVDGRYSATASQSKPGKSGGTTTTPAVTFVVDTTGPTVSLSAAATVDEGSTASLSYTIDDGAGVGRISEVQVSCGSGSSTNATNSDAAGSFDCNFADGPVSEGVFVQATDTLGNAGTAATAAIDVLNVAPVAVVSGGAASVEEGSAAEYSFALSDAGNDSIDAVDPSCGSGIVSGLAFDSSAASFSCEFPTAGATSVSLVATDADGAASRPVSMDVDVMPRPAPEQTEGPGPTSTPDPTEDPGPEPTPEPTIEPTPEPSGTPGPDPTPEPTDEPGPLPTPTIPIPVPEPTEEPSPEPTEEPKPTPSPEVSGPLPTPPLPIPPVPGEEAGIEPAGHEPLEVIVIGAADAISPNGDGVLDETTFDLEFSAPVTWVFTLASQHQAIESIGGYGDSFNHIWDGTDGENVVPDGTYEWELKAAPERGDARRVSGQIVVDTDAPDILDLDIAKGGKTAASISIVVAEDSRVSASISRGKRVVRTLTRDVSGGEPSTMRWRGRDSSRQKLPRGRYTVRVVAVDRAGNPASAPIRTVKL